MLKENLNEFCLELNKVKGIKENFSAIILNDHTIELYFNEKAFNRVTDENNRVYKKFEKLLDKYSLEYDRQLYENFSMSEYDDAEEEKISNRIIILDKALEEIDKELRGK